VVRQSGESKQELLDTQVLIWLRWYADKLVVPTFEYKYVVFRRDQNLVLCTPHIAAIQGFS
jgi:hypothetical protein